MNSSDDKWDGTVGTDVGPLFLGASSAQCSSSSGILPVSGGNQSDAGHLTDRLDVGATDEIAFPPERGTSPFSN